MLKDTLKGIGEIGLIKKFFKLTKVDKTVVKGIDDDTAVIRFKDDKYLLFTCDMLIEDVHFRRFDNPQIIGHKALACSLSDIAAMGGVPRYAVVSLGLPRMLSVNFVEDIYKGILNLAKVFKTNIVGGDTNRAEKIIINVSLLGEVKKKETVLRNGARVGDFIFVTGRLGGSFKSGHHLSFMPCIKEARFLVTHLKLNSMIDISDGLANDLTQIIKASNKGAVIYEEFIPKNSYAESLDDVLYTGEDFQLLFTLSPNQANKLLTIKHRIKTPITFIGQIMPKNFGLKLIDKSCREKELIIKGFQHF